MQGPRYTSRGLRRRNNTDKWEVTLSHVDPVTGETVRTFHTVDAKTKKGTEKARDALIFRLESDGGAIGSSAPSRVGCEHALDRIAPSACAERLRPCPIKNPPRTKRRSLPPATLKSGT